MANLEHIQFRGILCNSSNEPVADFHTIIQFYNMNLNSWVSLTETLIFNEGKLNYLLEIPDRISTSNQTIRIVREVLKSGGVPSFRIVKENRKQEKLEIVARDVEVHIVKEKELLIIDFGKNWLLKEEAIITTETSRIIASSIPMFEMNQLIATYEKDKQAFQQEREVLQQEISILNTNVTTLSQEKEVLASQLVAIEDQVNEKEVRNSELNEAVNALNTRLSVAEEEREVFQQKVIEITLERDNLIKERSAFLDSVKLLQDNVKRHKEAIKTRDTELQAKQVLINSLEKKAVGLEKELEEAKAFNNTEHPNKLAASKVYGSIVKDVIKADEELQTSRFKLANVSLNLKTTVEKGPEGTMLGLLDFETAKGINGAAISDISIDIVPNAAAVENEGQKMPNILGLTETAVRKLLLEYGLKLDAVYHPTKDTNLIAGQSFKQSPAPEANITEGQEVIVIFAKPLN